MPYKGGRFEREFCKLISLWWTNGESDAVFWRTSNSGGRATVRSRKSQKTTNAYGDVCAIDPTGKPFLDYFTLELKRGYNKVTVQDLLECDPPKDPKHPCYVNWIRQAMQSKRDAESVSWMVVHKRDNRDAVVLMDSPSYRMFPRLLYLDCIEITSPHVGEVVMLKMSELFDTLTPKDFKRKVRK